MTRVSRRETVRTCRLCDLWRTSKSNCIPGRGHSEPILMFIGQAPGGEEDLENKCFVGPAGQLLMDSIKEYNLDEFPHRFENTCRCYPPNDKRPSKKQVTACWTHLESAIMRYDPEFLVPLGSVALEAITGLKKVSDFMGSLFEIEGEEGQKTYKVFPILHPAAILRDERKLGAFESQMTTLYRIVNQSKSRVRSKPKYQVIEDSFVAEIDLDEIPDNRPTVIDFETYGGFDPRADDTGIRCIGVCHGINKARSYSFEKDEKMKDVVIDFLKRHKHLIAHNGKYEAKWAIQKLGVDPQIVDDTAIIAHLINEETSISLDVVGPMFCDMVNHKGSFRYFMAKNGLDWKTAPMDKLGYYNCEDCDMTFRVWKAALPQLEKLGMTRLYREVEIPTMRTLARIELRGMVVDDKTAEKVKRKGRKRMDQIRTKIEHYPEVEKGMKKAGLEHLNLNSSPQVYKLFYQWWMLARRGGKDGGTIRRTKSGQFSTDKNMIDRLAEDFPQVNLVKEYRGISHSLSDIEVMQEKAIDHFVSSDYNNVYVVTGRLSSRDPNLQNLPNPKEIEDDGQSYKFGEAVKQVIVSRFGEDGYVMNADYSQLELRLVGNESGDPTYIDALNGGKDLHTITARHLPGVNPNNVSKEQRFIAKRLNFAVVYGAGPGELAKNFRKRKEECAAYLRSYAETYPHVMQYMDDLHDFARDKGYVISKFKRRRHLPQINAEDWWLAKRAMNQAGNFPVASLGADLTKWAMATIDEYLISGDYKSLVMGQVHDSIVIDCYKRELRRVCSVVEGVMIELAMNTWPFFEKIPMKVDISIGPNWLNQEDL